MESIELVRELNEFAHTLLELEIDRCVPSMLCGYGCAPGLSCQEIELPLVDGSCEDPVPTMLCLP